MAEDRSEDDSSSSDDSDASSIDNRAGSNKSRREKKKRKKEIDRSRSRRSSTGSTDYKGVLSAMLSPEKRKLVQMAQMSMTTGKEVTENTQPHLAAYQRLAKESYNDSMEAAGLNDSQKDKEKRVAR
jgi:hypothetical protein